MLIGYARTSTADHTKALQLDALTRAGCSRIFEDTASGSIDSRPGLAEAIATCQPGDTLTVWKLDRLGRSLAHLIETVAGLTKRGVGFRTLTESIDTTTPGGELVFHIFGALAQFERALIRERTIAGLAADRSRGRVGGRRAKLSADQADHARALLADGQSIAAVARIMGVARATIYRVR